MVNIFSTAKDKYQKWKQDVILQTSMSDQDKAIQGEEWDEMGYHRPMAAYF